MLIVDDEYYIRTGIASAIDWGSMNVKIVGTAQDGDEGLSIALEKKPDLILLDICMPFLNGLELMEKLREAQIDCEFIVLSGYDEFEYARQSIKYGALDYLLKPIDKQKLREAVSNACLTIRNRKSLQNYQQLAKQELSSFHKQFLKDLLLDNLNDENTVTEKMRLMNLPLFEDYYQVICVKLDDYNLLERNLQSEQLREQKVRIQKWLNNHFTLGSHYMGMITAISPEEWGIVLSYPESVQEDILLKELHFIMDSFLADLERDSSCTVSVSISTICTQVAQMPDLYRTIRRINKKFIPFRNSVTWPDMDPASGIRPEILGALNFIYNHYNEDITIQKVADSLYISSSYLMHLFKTDVGKTFNTFLMEYRMERAKELLKTPGIQIQEVSRQTGYNDVKYFHKLFKRHTGLTPSDYVRTHYAR